MRSFAQREGKICQLLSRSWMLMLTCVHGVVAWIIAGILQFVDVVAGWIGGLHRWSTGCWRWLAASRTFGQNWAGRWHSTAIGLIFHDQVVVTTVIIIASMMLVNVAFLLQNQFIDHWKIEKFALKLVIGKFFSLMRDIGNSILYTLPSVCMSVCKLNKMKKPTERRWKILLCFSIFYRQHYHITYRHMASLSVS